MTEPLGERLRRFTPDAAGLDRDAWLFAAGRASVHANRWWAALAGALAACQLLTLVLLWPRAVPPTVVSVPSPALSASGSREKAAPLPGQTPPEWGGQRQPLLSAEGALPPPAAVGPLVPDAPPLRVDAMPSALAD